MAYFNKSLFLVLPATILLGSFFAVAKNNTTEGKTVGKPVISLTGVNGVDRIISISSSNSSADIQYVIDEDTLVYTAPFSISSSKMIHARASINDSVYKDGELVRVNILYSRFDSLFVEAGTEIQLNPVDFKLEPQEGTNDMLVTLTSDQSDILLQPEPTIVYSTSNVSMEVENGAVLEISSGTISAFAKAEGYKSSRIKTFTVEKLPYVGTPEVKLMARSSNGSRNVVVKNTVSGYPIPTIYYELDGATPVEAKKDTIVFPANTKGLLKVYATALNYPTSDTVYAYLDSRQQYNQPYVAVTPQSTSLPTVAGDMEVFDFININIQDYPNSNITPTGNIYFHVHTHANFNNFGLPFNWISTENIVTDAYGNELTYGVDFWIYSLDDLTTAENLYNGSIMTNRVDSRNGYLLKVRQSLVGQDLIFISKRGDQFLVSNSAIEPNFQSSLKSRTNRRLQYMDIMFNNYTINSTGTAFVLNESTTLKSFQTVLLPNNVYAQQHPTIELIYHPSLSVSPENGSYLESLSSVTISAPYSMDHMDLADNGYLTGGSKSIYVYKHNGSSVRSAQLSRVDSRTFKLTLSSAIDTDGSYDITLPEGFFVCYPPSTSEAGSATSDRLDLQFNVLTNFTYQSNPTPGTYSSLQNFTVSFNKDIALTGNGLVSLVHNGDIVASYSASQLSANGWVESRSIKVKLSAPITEGGSYQLTIPSGFLKFGGTVVYDEEIVINYTIPVTRTRKNFTEETVLFINSGTIPNLYDQGWFYSDAEGNFVTTQFYMNYIDPLDNDEISFDNLGAAKVSLNDDEHIHLDVAGVDSVVFYVANPGALTYYCNIQGQSEIESFSFGLPVPAHGTAIGSYRLYKEDYDLKLWAQINPTYLYAVKFITDASIYQGIESVIADDDKIHQVFDLTGQPVQDLKPGIIYVRDGKKFLYKE